MQKSMFLNNKIDKAQHLLKLGTGVIKGALPAWKTSNILIFFTGRLFTHFFFENFWKIHQCASKTCYERYDSDDLF